LELQKESRESEQGDVSEDEARELFDMMKDEYNEMITLTPEELGLENHPDLPAHATSLESSVITTPQELGLEHPLDLPAHHTTSLESSVDTADVRNVVREENFPTSSTSMDIAFESDVITKVSQIRSKIGSHSITVDMSQHESVAASEPSTYQQSDAVLEKFGSDLEVLAPIYGATTRTVTFEPDHRSEESFRQDEQISTGDMIAGTGDSNLSATSRSDELFLDESNSQGFEVADSEVTDSDEVDSAEAEYDYKLGRLRELLPSFSDFRLNKIIEVYDKSLGDPSFLELIPIVRENMPDYVTATWLKQMTSLTASFVIQKAAEENVINTEILNAVLELQTSGGSLDRAIEFHQTEFALHNVEPTEYSDRLVLQMLLRNNRFNRALAFKQIVDGSGRSLDIKAYGSLIEYCSRRRQLGSALLLLKECLSVHSAPPGEASLSNLRLLCRQAGIEDEIGLAGMIGQDPVEWLRHGERELKREYSKKGRRDVQLSRNVAVRI
jgi:hypothetical protein